MNVAYFKRPLTDKEQRFTQILSESTVRNRPNKLARGTSYTAARSKHELTGEALSIAVAGTTDKCNPVRFLTARIPITPCNCCGHVRHIVGLNERGKSKLNILRRGKE